MILLDKWDKDGFDSNEEYKKVRKNISHDCFQQIKKFFQLYQKVWQELTP